MNCRSPRQAKRVESVTDVSYEIVRRLRYKDGNDNDDNDDDDDDDDDDKDEENENENENEKSISSIRSYALRDRRHVVVFLFKPIDLPQRRNVRAAGINISSAANTKNYNCKVNEKKNVFMLTCIFLWAKILDNYFEE